MRIFVRFLVTLAALGALVAPALAPSAAAAGISVSPTSGAIGTNTTVSGNGFVANAAVQVFFNGSGGTLVGTGTADGAGNLPAMAIGIPDVAAGTYQIFATDGSNTGTTPFTVPSSLTLSPASGGQGTGVTVSGTGFLSGEVIIVGWDQPGNQVATATANSNGAFSTGFSTPSAGAHTVFATGQTSNFQVSATFNGTGQQVACSNGDANDARPGNGFGDQNHCHTGPRGNQDNGNHGQHGNQQNNSDNQGEDN